MLLFLDCDDRVSLLFFLKDPPTAEIYTLSLHDALPIYRGSCRAVGEPGAESVLCRWQQADGFRRDVYVSCHRQRTDRSEEHTSELQSLRHLVCRLLLEKKKKKD